MGLVSNVPPLKIKIQELEGGYRAEIKLSNAYDVRISCISSLSFIS
jgi:hypothetical protein